MSQAGMDRYRLLSPEVLADPYPTYHRLRAEAPVYWNEGIGGWCVTRYRDVAALLRDPRTSCERLGRMLRHLSPTEQRELEPLTTAFRRWLVFIDPPDHTRLRALIGGAFTPAVIEPMRSRIETLVDELLDAVVAADAPDLIADLAYPLPAVVICEMLGARPEDREQIRRWSDDITLVGAGRLDLETMRRIQRGVLEMTAYFREIAAERRAQPQPQPDLLSSLLAAEEAGDRLHIEELLATCALLLFAGHVTTTHLIGNGVLALLRHPDQLQRLRSAPELIPSAVEEILRYESPIQYINRAVVEDLTIDGQQIRAGQIVMTIVGAANRDPEQFADPDRFDVARGNNRHLAFGLGAHFCVGASLARLEGTIALAGILRRLPNLRLRTSTPEWQPLMINRALKALPIDFDRPS